MQNSATCGGCIPPEAQHDIGARQQLPLCAHGILSFNLPGGHPNMERFLVQAFQKHGLCKSIVRPTKACLAHHAVRSPAMLQSLSIDEWNSLGLPIGVKRSMIAEAAAVFQQQKVGQPKIL